MPAISSHNNLISIPSSKRRKLSENMSENFPSKSTFTEDSESNLSVTIYEDKSEELVYFNKSSKKRLINASQSKRSPLASINKPISRLDEVSSQLRLDEGYCRRIQSRTLIPTAIDQFSRLSDEIVLHIFQYLPKKALTRLAQVNSRFSRITTDESLWVRMDLGNRSLLPAAPGKIFSRGLIICRLAQAKIPRPIFDEHLEGIQLKLQCLDLSLASIDKSSLTQLLSACRILKKLSLEQLELDNEVCKEIGENSNLEVSSYGKIFIVLFTIFLIYSKSQVLNLSMCEGLTAQAVTTLTSKLTSIVALNVSWTNLSNESVMTIVNTISPTLLRLNISGCRRSLTDSSKLRVLKFLKKYYLAH